MERHRLAPDLEAFCLNAAEATFLFQEIFAGNAYLRHGIAIRDGDCVFDVGASIGLFGVYLHRTWSNLRLYSFEPIPQVFEVLKANASLHGLQARLFNCGLAEQSGRVSFTFYPKNSVMSGRYADPVEDRNTTRTYIGNRNPSFVAQAHKDPAVSRHFDGMIDGLFRSESVECELRRLSDVIRHEHVEAIDLLKVDVEKSEHQVLAGIDDEHWPRIRQIVVELHDVEGRMAQWAARLGALGFQVAVDQDPMLANTNIHTLYGRRA